MAKRTPSNKQSKGSPSAKPGAKPPAARGKPAPKPGASRGAAGKASAAPARKVPPSPPIGTNKVKPGPAAKSNSRMAPVTPSHNERPRPSAAPRPTDPPPPAPDSAPSHRQHDDDDPLPKSYLTDAELQKFKELLLQKRAELCGDVRSLRDEALSRSGAGHGEQSSMPIHMADLGTDNWEQEFTLGLIASEQAVVREIDAALERIDERTYGMCLATHKRISKARLRAKPWARYCIEYERAREEGRAP